MNAEMNPLSDGAESEAAFSELGENLADRIPDTREGSIEKKENVLLGQVGVAREIFAKISQSPEVQKAARALARSGLNLGVMLVEEFPIYGHATDAVVDSVKYLKFLSKHFESLDITPAVSGKMAAFLEFTKFITCGIFPAHTVETLLQLYRKDWSEIRGGFRAIAEILRERKKDIEDPELEAAAKEFE